MTAEGEILALDVIEASLATSLIGRASGHANELWPTIDSTNSRAAELASAGAAEGVLVLARQQTAGRGRQGRVWVTPQDAGIAFSVILRPTIPLTRLPLVTLATGTAVARAIESSVGVRLGLKWVNDLVLGGRKVGGILAEMSGPSLIIGIGINVRFSQEDIPEDLQTKIEWLERVVGKVGGRSGSFVIQSNGTFVGHSIKGTWFIVPGSGTGELQGLRGEGEMNLEGQKEDWPVTFEYSFE